MKLPATENAVFCRMQFHNSDGQTLYYTLSTTKHEP